MELSEWLAGRLRGLDSSGLLRVEAVDQRRQVSGEDFIDLTSNDYLGLGGHAVSRETLLGVGDLAPSGRASRLIHGTHPSHLALERDLAEWVGLERALLFSSGYAANVGALTALTTADDVVVSDALNHASIIDACRLSRADVRVTPHLDIEAAATALTGGVNRWLVLEARYSMDGDAPDLAAAARVCRERGAYLYVDEAHALGVEGPCGAGACAAAGVRPDVLVGTLGKAIGAQGAFVAGCPALRDWLWNRARSFVYSTATSPLSAGVARSQLRRAREADPERARLRRHCQQFREALDLQLPGPVFPLRVSNPMTLASDLAARGVLVQPNRPPTVPTGGERLRASLSAGLSAADLERALTVLRELL